MSSANAGEGLIDAIADAVAARLEQFVGMRQRLFDIDQAAEYLGMTPVALRHKAGTEIPTVTIDAKLRFDLRDLNRYIDQAPRKGV